jgi:3-hydroxypropionate dehydrogenase (NADP+)
MEIKRVACVGAGFIGLGWATLYSSKGIEVILHDISNDLLGKALTQIKLNLLFLEKHRLLKRGCTDVALKKIKTTLNLVEAVYPADFVTESVPENYAIKKKLFKAMDEIAPEHAILASSSSGLLMTEIQKATNKPERCVMTHPVLPLHLIPLVEIVGGEKTSKETIMRTYKFMASLGRTPVVLNKEVPGYIVNRLSAALWREAVSLVSTGVASAEDVDRAFCKGIGLRDPIFGPCLRAHIAGGSIEGFLDKLHESYTERWKTMETWTSIPSSAAKKVIKSVYEMNIIRTKTFAEIEELRDEKLAKILKIMLPKHPFY